MIKPRHMDRQRRYPKPVERQVTLDDGTKMWYTDGQLHRIGQPAKVYANGGEEWYVNGNLHRDGEPAVKYACGYALWYENNLLHCLRGPAVVHECGYYHHMGECEKAYGKRLCLLDKVEWFVRGIRFTEDEFYRFVDTQTGELFIPPGRALQRGFTTRP